MDAGTNSYTESDTGQRYTGCLAIRKASLPLRRCGVSTVYVPICLKDLRNVILQNVDPIDRPDLSLITR